MNILGDVIIVACGILAIISGLRRGLIATAAAAVGTIGGIWLGIVAAPVINVVLEQLLPGFVPRTMLVFAVIVCIAILCWSLCRTLARMLMHASSAVPGGRTVNRVGGGVFGALSAATVTWLVAGLAASSGILPLVQVAQSSSIVAGLNRVAPVSTGQVFSAVDDAFQASGLPNVFKGQEAPIVAVEDPPRSATDAVVASSRQVAKISATKYRCGVEAAGSGWPISATEIVTNAHVVAGASSVRVAMPESSRTYAARVVAFDPELDLAVLRVLDLHATPLTIASHNASANTAVYGAGYPGGGALTITPGRVRSVVNALGLDIYNERSVTRQIYSLRADIRGGDSGGPLLDAAGHVVGVVFARSTTDADTGYALTIDQVRSALNAASGQTQAVGTGRCSSE